MVTESSSSVLMLLVQQIINKWRCRFRLYYVNTSNTNKCLAHLAYPFKVLKLHHCEFYVTKDSRSSGSITHNHFPLPSPWKSWIKGKENQTRFLMLGTPFGLWFMIYVCFEVDWFAFLWVVCGWIWTGLVRFIKLHYEMFPQWYQKLMKMMKWQVHIQFCLCQCFHSPVAV